MPIFVKDAQISKCNACGKTSISAAEVRKRRELADTVKRWIEQDHMSEEKVQETFQELEEMAEDK